MRQRRITRPRPSGENSFRGAKSITSATHTHKKARGYPWQSQETPGRAAQAHGHPQGDSQGEPHKHTGRPRKAPGYAQAARRKLKPHRKPQDTLRKVQRDLDPSRFPRAFPAGVRMLLRSNRCNPSVRTVADPAISKGLGEAISHGEL